MSLANVGTIDRVLRLVLGAALIIYSLSAQGGVNTTVGLAMIGVGAVLAVTAAIRFCPLYRLIGVKPCSRNA